MRRKPMTMVPCLILAATVGMTFANCTRRKATPKAATETKAATPATPTVSNEILNFGNLAEPQTIDPGLAEGVVEVNMVSALFEGLLEYDPKDLHIVPGVAERWEISPDGLTYTFHLRKNAVWSDGKPVTAHDFVYAWERALNPKTAAKMAYVLFPIKNSQPYNSGKITDPNQLGLMAIDDQTFQVRLEQPTAYFLSLMPYTTYHPVPRRTIEQHGGNWIKPENIVGNGAFVLKSWTPQKELVVEKNPKYWDAANVKLAGVRFHPIDDRETALKMYESGQLDISWEVPLIKIPMLKGRPDLVPGPYLATEYIRVNTTKPPLNDARVRRAMAMAIDRKTMYESFVQSGDIPWTSVVPPGLAGYMPAPGSEFNPTEAKRLLAEAGFADPALFPVLTYTYNTKDVNKTIAEVLQRMWKENLGITVNLINQEWKVYLNTMKTMDFELLRSGWVGDYLDPYTFLDLWTAQSTNNLTGWTNKEYDRLIDGSTKETNMALRLNQLRQAEEIVLKELPIINLSNKAKTMLVRPYVKGFYSNLLYIHPMKWVSMEGKAAVAGQ